MKKRRSASRSLNDLARRVMSCPDLCEDARAKVPPCSPDCPRDYAGLPDYIIEAHHAQLACILRKDAVLQRANRKATSGDNAGFLEDLEQHRHWHRYQRELTLETYTAFRAVDAYASPKDRVSVADMTICVEPGLARAWMPESILGKVLLTDLACGHEVHRCHVVPLKKVLDRKEQQGRYLRVLAQQYQDVHGKVCQFADVYDLQRDLAADVDFNRWFELLSRYSERQGEGSHPIFHFNFSVTDFCVQLLDQSRNWTSWYCRNPGCINFFQELFAKIRPLAQFGGSHRSGEAKEVIPILQGHYDNHQ